LLGWLDGGADSQGQKYEEMRRKLVAYFDRKDCRSPDDLADETFNRVIKWLEEQGRDYDPEPAKICYNTARFVFHEYLRRPTVSRMTLMQYRPPASRPQIRAGLPHLRKSVKSGRNASPVWKSVRRSCPLMTAT